MTQDRGLALSYPAFGTAMRAPAERAAAAQAASAVADLLEAIGVRYWLAHHTLLQSQRFAGPAAFNDPTAHLMVEPINDAWLGFMAGQNGFLLTSAGFLYNAWTCAARFAHLPIYIYVCRTSGVK
jgi:hypothetical protein